MLVVAGVRESASKTHRRLKLYAGGLEHGMSLADKHSLINALSPSETPPTGDACFIISSVAMLEQSFVDSFMLCRAPTQPDSKATTLTLTPFPRTDPYEPHYRAQTTHPVHTRLNQGASTGKSCRPYARAAQRRKGKHSESLIQGETPLLNLFEKHGAIFDIALANHRVGTIQNGAAPHGA